MTERSSIAIETVLDWAYCEAKVWWQTVGRSIEEEAEFVHLKKTFKTRHEDGFSVRVVPRRRLEPNVRQPFFSL